MTVQPSQIRGGDFRGATGHIRISNQPNDADTVTITTPSGVVVYEFDNNAAVTAGRILVTIGGSTTITAANLRAAIIASQSDLAASIGPITTIAGALDAVDLRVVASPGTLTLAESSGAARAVVKDNGDESITGNLITRVIRRAVVAEDVTRALIVVDFGMSSIASYTIDIQTTATDETRIAYAGPQSVVVTNGVARLVLDNSGGTDFAAAQILFVTATGTAA